MEKWKEKLIKSKVERLVTDQFDFSQDIELIRDSSEVLMNQLSPIIKADITVGKDENPVYEGKDIITIALNNNHAFKIFADKNSLTVDFCGEVNGVYCDSKGFSTYEIVKSNNYKARFTCTSYKSNLEEIPKSTINYAKLMNELFERALADFKI